MKTKTKIKLTPLFAFIIQTIILIATPFLLAIDLGVPFISIKFGLVFYFFGMYIVLPYFHKEYIEEFLGILRYKIVKMNNKEKENYFIKSKPLLLIFLPWRNEWCSNIAFSQNGEECLMRNNFKNTEEAKDAIEKLKNRPDVKKFILIKKWKIVS